MKSIFDDKHSEGLNCIVEVDVVAHMPLTHHASKTSILTAYIDAQIFRPLIEATKKNCRYNYTTCRTEQVQKGELFAQHFGLIYRIRVQTCDACDPLQLVRDINRCVEELGNVHQMMVELCKESDTTIDAPMLEPAVTR